MESVGDLVSQIPFLLFHFSLNKVITMSVRFQKSLLQCVVTDEFIKPDSVCLKARSNDLNPQEGFVDMPIRSANTYVRVTVGRQLQLDEWQNHLVVQTVTMT